MKKLLHLAITLIAIITSINKSHAQANQQLSNLIAPTSVNAHLIPSNNAKNLGSATKSWKEFYLNGDIFLDGSIFMTNRNIASNTFLGSAAGNSTSGSNNTGMGYQSLFTNTAGTDNTAIGIQSLYSNTSGSYNTASGRYSLYFNNGSYNTANGVNALYSNTSGSSNTATGYQSLQYNTTGNNNTAIGLQSLFSNTTASNNISVGQKTLFSNTTGSYNSASGTLSLYNNTTGNNNTANGYQSLYANTTGAANTAIGYQSLYSSYSNGNTAVGSQALYSNQAGFDNTAIGAGALQYNNNFGTGNTALGFGAMSHSLQGSDNTATGLQALESNTGDENTANGEFALASNTSGSANTALGYKADVSSSGLTDATAIGANAIVDASYKVRIGDASITSIGGQVSWTNFSDARIKQNIKENVPGLAFINLLKPVTYNFNINKENELMGINPSSNKESKAVIEKINFTGFLAQDVDAAAQKINYDFSGVDKSGKIMGLRYSEFVVPLVKSVQELSKENDDLKQQLLDLSARVQALENGTNSSSQNNSQINKRSNSYLYQIAPNPFSQNATISFTLPSNTTNAQLLITDASGKTVQTYTVAKGSTQQQINANNLIAGVYNYSLIVNGEIIDSKQMVITK